MNKLFSEDQIQEILQYQGLLTQSQIAEKFNTDRRRISEVMNGVYGKPRNKPRIKIVPKQNVNPKPQKIKMTYWSNE